MRAIELLEYDINKMKTLDLSRRSNDSSRPPASIDKLAEFLETTYKLSGEIVFWLLHRYVNGTARWEDIESRIIPGLEKYQKLKNKKKLSPELRDINRIKTFTDFEDLLDKFNDEEVISNKDQEKEIENNFYRTGQADYLYDDKTIKVVIPRTEAASCYFGRNTRWCTAAKNNNAFDDYGLNKDDPLYIILIKPTNERYQFHFGSHQFMDERDIEISPRKIALQYPKLFDIFKNKAKEYIEIGLIKNPTDQEQIDAVNLDATAIRDISNPCCKAQVVAVDQYPDLIKNIADPCEDAEIKAVSSEPDLIIDINEPSKRVQLAAVKKDGSVLRFIKNIADDDVKAAAVTEDGTAIQYIDNPSEHLQLLAVNQSIVALRGISNPTETVKLEAVKQQGGAIQYIDDPSDAIKIAAIKQDGSAIKYINDPDERLQFMAVDNDPYAIVHIQNPPKALLYKAIKKDPDLIRWFENASETLKLVAINGDPTLIQFMDNPSKKMQMAAIKQNPRLISLIVDPDPEVVAAAKS